MLVVPGSRKCKFGVHRGTWLLERSYHVIVDAPREIGQVEFEAIHLLC